MRVKIPEFSEKKELFRYLIANKSEIIAQKKATPIKSDDFTCAPILPDAHKTYGVKAKGGDFGAHPGSLVVDVIANLSLYADSYLDVMMPDSWAKSINEKATNIPFLHDHKWQVDAKIAKTLAVYAEEITLSELGINSDVKTAQALMFKGEFSPDINEKLYNLYKRGMVNQHSIGLQYVKIELAVNDPDESEEYKAWNRYYSQVINKEYVNRYGFFWAVKEAKIFENSAVLFGANEMTPTMSLEEIKSLINEPPPDGTQGSKPNNQLKWGDLKNLI